MLACFLLYPSCSLSGNSVIRGHCDILADATECTNRVVEFLRGVDAFTHRKRVRVVIELHLGFASLASIDGTHGWILIVQPTALNISLLLWVIPLRVHFADKVGDLMDSLLLGLAEGAPCQSFLCRLELSGCISRGLVATLTEVVPVLGAEVASVMGRFVSGNDCSKALGRGVHWPINE